VHPDTAGSASAFRRLATAERYAEASLTDRLSLTNALADADIDRQKAERIATEIFDAIHDNVATKQGLERVEATLLALGLPDGFYCPAHSTAIEAVISEGGDLSETI